MSQLAEEARLGASRSTRMRSLGLTPFEEFTALQRLSAVASHRFLNFVANSGGGLCTDLATLGLIFEIWEKKGRR